ncbi:MAG: hypothetical protein QOF60_1083 [Actinomycetota bacterium]|jgi:hypothetical protein|nr:hypothetical protein [Actinomycetota bacterium]
MTAGWDTKILVLDTTSLHVVAEVPTPPDIRPIAIACGPSVVVGLQIPTLYRIEGDKAVPAGSFAAGDGVGHLAYYGDGRVVATDGVANLVVFCDGRAENCVTRPLDGQPRDISAMGSTVAILSWTGTQVAFFNGDTYELEGRMPVPRLPRGLLLG